jgi:hypothetical protein
VAWRDPLARERGASTTRLQPSVGERQFAMARPRVFRHSGGCFIRDCTADSKHHLDGCAGEQRRDVETRLVRDFLMFTWGFGPRGQRQLAGRAGAHQTCAGRVPSGLR